MRRGELSEFIGAAAAFLAVILVVFGTPAGIFYLCDRYEKNLEISINEYQVVHQWVEECPELASIVAHESCGGKINRRNFIAIEEKEKELKLQVARDDIKQQLGASLGENQIKLK